MPLIKMSRQDFARTASGGRRSGNPEYIRFLQALKPGEGGKAVVADEGVSRQSVKNRLGVAAKAVGVGLKYHRSGDEEVIFEVVDPGDAPKRRRGAQKTD